MSRRRRSFPTGKGESFPRATAAGARMPQAHTSRVFLRPTTMIRGHGTLLVITMTFKFRRFLATVRVLNVIVPVSAVIDFRKQSFSFFFLFTRPSTHFVRNDDVNALRAHPLWRASHFQLQPISSSLQSNCSACQSNSAARAWNTTPTLYSVDEFYIRRPRFRDSSPF